MAFVKYCKHFSIKIQSIKDIKDTYVTFLIRLTVFLRKEKTTNLKTLSFTQKYTQLSKCAKCLMVLFL